MANVTSILTIVADLATIVTAGIAIWAAATFGRRRRVHRRVLEDYLASQDRGLLVSEIAATLRLSEEQVAEAARGSKKIHMWTTKPMIGAPAQLMLRAKEDGQRAPGPTRRVTY